ncbi:hypothetical protein [Mycolicibacterium septicum]|uniref:hypothetical protein n=1 Tax=Mycolicibacterium septicum TaxID=98668 RepID=UPI001AF1119E|nr:hypothetical protein [Mycolicibacterium septicum]QRY50491.1 hypothetical protein JVX95_23855 [Mycolicibacterium septicum]
MKPRTVALCSIVGLAAIFLTLTLTGAIGPGYRWMVRYFAPEVWSAIGTWATAIIAIVTVVVAGRYAKQQVEKAQEQIREAQNARLDQERQAQEAIATQVRIAEEQSQPNVVLYTELNPSVKQYIEIVIKNFGTTPAYHVEAVIDPPLRATPNLISKGKLSDVPIPKFPILAPGQEWRTGWDHSISRKQHQKKWAPLAGKTESELTDKEKSLIQAHMSYTGETYSYEQAISDMTLSSVHTVRVLYENSQGKSYETNAILDSELFKGTTWVDIKTTHDLTKLLDKKFDSQNKLLDAIHDRLAEFGSEHEGIWVYNSSDDEERQYRRFIAAAQRRESRESHDHLDWQLSGRNGEDPQTRANLDDVFHIPIENANIGDWYVPQTDAPVEAWQAWRIAFVKRHVFEEFGTIYELFRSDGESIRERKGTQIQIVRADPS